MDQPVITAARVPQPTMPQQACGPVELDPSLFELVAGGSPRVGWQIVTSSLVEVDSPRAGW